MLVAYLLIFVLAGFCIYLLSRVTEVENRLEALGRELERATTRLAAKPQYTEPEGERAAVSPMPAAVAPVLPEPVPLEPVPPEPAPPEIPQYQPVPFAPELLRPAVFEPRPTLSDRLRALLGDEEWETLVGGSLLNKLGALVLVIGIALFLGFSFAHMSAAGRASIALVVSLTILGAGVWLERRERYRVFARGLIGAGWAALYATAYAIYGIAEARIIANPLIGSLLLLGVAGGMIAHALRYRSEAVTGVAYFAAFAALAVSPSSPLALVALIPLAASLLYLAARFDWYTMPLFGLAATWLTCISRGQSSAPLFEVQALLVAYWLIFDAFDLLRARRGVVAGGVEWLYPVNLAGLIGLSYLAWTRHDPARLWQAAFGGTLLFLADAIARAYLRPPLGALPDRLRAGSFEASSLVSAVLGGFAIVGSVPGVWLSAGLALEAEMLYLVGVRFNSPFLRRMGFAAFAHSLLRLAVTTPGSRTEILGHNTWNQTPTAVFHAVLFYFNRALRIPSRLMSSTGAALIAIVIVLEVPDAFIGLALILFGIALLLIGVRKRQSDFRFQSYVLFAGGALADMQAWYALSALALSLAALYGCALWSRSMDIPERRWLAGGASAAAALVAAVLIWRAVPVPWLALSWCALAFVALELGNRRLPWELRHLFAPVGALAVGALVYTHTNDLAKFPEQAVWISWFGFGLFAWAAAARNSERALARDVSAVLGTIAILTGIWLVTPDPYVTVLWTILGIGLIELRAPAILANGGLAFAAIYYRLFDCDLNNAPLRAMPVAVAGLYWAWYRFREQAVPSQILFWLAPVPLLALIEHESGLDHAALGWMIVSIALLIAHVRFGVRYAAVQSYAIAVLAFLCALILSPLWNSAATIAGLCAAWLIVRNGLERRPSIFFSLLATLLLAAVLYREVSGSLLTVSWGFEGLALLGCGFALRERIPRLEGLALLLFCILKLFIYDLRNLETIYRILSFVALGLILLAVSWIYTRFREHLRKLL